MLIRIISALLSLLLSIFPFFQKTKSLDNDTVANIVISAVQNRDEESLKALEDIMCLNIKQNTDDLPAKIMELINFIDGDVTEISWDRVKEYSESDGNGKYLQQNGQGYSVYTTTGKYAIVVVLETYNSFAPDEMGIRAFSILDEKNPDEAIVLGKIKATEGIFDTHN